NKISVQILRAVAIITIAKKICKYLVLVRALTLAPIGAAITLTIITTITGLHNTSPVNNFPVVVPIEERNVIPKEVAMVILFGIYKIVIMTGTSKNAPPAPTIPAPTPIINERILAKILLYSKSAPEIPISLSGRGTSISITANSAKTPYTKLIVSLLILLDV